MTLSGSLTELPAEEEGKGGGGRRERERKRKSTVGDGVFSILYLGIYPIVSVFDSLCKIC